MDFRPNLAKAETSPLNATEHKSGFFIGVSWRVVSALRKLESHSLFAFSKSSRNRKKPDLYSTLVNLMSFDVRMAKAEKSKYINWGAILKVPLSIAFRLGSSLTRCRYYASGRQYIYLALDLERYNADDNHIALNLETYTRMTWSELWYEGEQRELPAFFFEVLIRYIKNSRSK